MIYVKLVGRLGNQLFYYSVARAIQLQYPQYGEIVFILENYEYENWGGIQLLEFNINATQVAEKPILSLKQKIIDNEFKIIRKLLSSLKPSYNYLLTYRLQNFLNKNGLYCMVGSENIPLIFNSKEKNIYISGVWENPYYFRKYRHIILKEISPKKPILQYNRNIYEQIQKTNSVCISIRKGDFLKAGNERFNICSEQYFYKAISILESIAGKISLFIFSDDIEWCKKNLSFNIKATYENNNGKDPVWEKLRLMSACKHFIISNSSFSWWAQYLSKNEKKIVIAPRPWRKNEYCDCLYEENFILLDGMTGESNNIKKNLY